jgi:hypothetical protein
MKWIKKLWYRIKWGDIQFVVKCFIDYTPCEIEYYDRKGNVIGYWAYGSFDPAMPYQGQV